MDKDEPYVRLRSALRAGRVEEVQAALLLISYNSTDLRRDYDVVMECTASSEWQIRGSAFVGIAHLARIHGALPDQRALDAIGVSLTDPNFFVRGNAYTAAEEIAHAIPALEHRAGELMQQARQSGQGMTRLGAHSLALARTLVSKRVRRVERVRHVFRDEQPIDQDLVLWTDTGPLRFRPDADGEVLLVEASAWLDPFAGKEAANEAFFLEHGRNVLADVSKEAPYSQLVEQVVEDLSPRTNRDGSLVGIELVVDSARVHVLVDGDELYVTLGG